MDKMFAKENICVSFPGILLFFVNHKAFVCLLEINHLVSRGKAINGHRIWMAKTDSVTECAQMCLRRKPCLSFNFEESSAICELNDGVLSTDTPSKIGHNWIYSEISHWSSQIDPYCFSRSCNEDEVCVPGPLVLGQCCSYACIKLSRRCPILDGLVLHGSRLEGTLLNASCRRGYRLEENSDAVICQTNYQWNISANLSCKPIYGSVCQQDGDCVGIKGICHNLTCLCEDRFIYDDVIASCKKDCPTGWVLFESSCYLLGSEELKYTAARTSCLDLESSLVQVDTVAERSFLYERMRTTEPEPEYGYWNDLYEVTVNGQERWRETNDSLDISVADWNSGQPKDHRVPQKCTMFYKTFGYKWADLECEEHTGRKARALCEKSTKGF